MKAEGYIHEMVEDARGMFWLKISVPYQDTDVFHEEMTKEEREEAEALSKSRQEYNKALQKLHCGFITIEQPE